MKEESKTFCLKDGKSYTITFIQYEPNFKIIVVKFTIGKAFEYWENIRLEGDEKPMDALKRILKENGWKNLNELVEKRVLACFYMKAETLKLNNTDSFFDDTVRPLKELKYKIISAQEESSHSNGVRLNLMEEQAILATFDALDSEENFESTKFFTALKKAWKRKHRDGKDKSSYEISIAQHIYRIVFPDSNTGKGVIFAGGYKKPLFLSTGEIDKQLRNKCRTGGELRTLRKHCKNMNIDRDERRGRKAKSGK